MNKVVMDPSRVRVYKNSDLVELSHEEIRILEPSHVYPEHINKIIYDQDNGRFFHAAHRLYERSFPDHHCETLIERFEDFRILKTKISEGKIKGDT